MTGGGDLKLKALETGGGQNRGIHFRLVKELLQSGADIAPDGGYP